MNKIRKWLHDHFDILHDFTNSPFRRSWHGLLVEFTLCSVRDCRWIQWSWNTRTLWIDDVELDSFPQDFEEKKEETREALLAKKEKEYALRDYFAGQKQELRQT